MSIFVDDKGGKRVEKERGCIGGDQVYLFLLKVTVSLR
jgi:hypothetical protein